jgi:hypothetical protein
MESKTSPEFRGMLSTLFLQANPYHIIFFHCLKAVSSALAYGFCKKGKDIGEMYGFLLSYP